MISVSSKKWKEKKVNIKLIEKIQQEYNFSRIISQLIVSRNFDEYEIHQQKINQTVLIYPYQYQAFPSRRIFFLKDRCWHNVQKQPVRATSKKSSLKSLVVKSKLGASFFKE